MTNRPFQILAKPIGPICNLGCKYCFYLDKTKFYRGVKNYRMSKRVLKRFIKQKIESLNTDIVPFSWQGGEPTLLGLDFFKDVVKLQTRYSNGKIIQNGFQTNGVLLNDRWCDFFARNNFLVGLSIDGPEEIHDHYRRKKGGKPSFSDVMKGMSFLKKHNVDFNVLSVVNDFNSEHPIAVFDFLKNECSNFLQFIPAVDRLLSNNDPNIVKENQEANVHEWSVKPEQYGAFLCSIFDEWIKKDVGQVFIQIFDETLANFVGMPSSVCLFKKTCGDALAIEHNGDVYSCDHYVYPNYRLGNILTDHLNDMVNSDRQLKFGEHKKSGLPGYCQECEVKFACHGGCPKNRFIKTPNGENSLNYLCFGYKQFFKHVTPYMNFMANELRNKRPPSNVMSLFS